MFGLWCEAGFDPDSYWRQTPRLLQAAIDGYAARAKWDHRGRMTAAWHAAALGRAKKLPALDRLLGRKAERKAQTPEQIIAVMRSLMG